MKKLLLPFLAGALTTAILVGISDLVATPVRAEESSPDTQAPADNSADPSSVLQNIFSLIQSEIHDEDTKEYFVNLTNRYELDSITSSNDAVQVSDEEVGMLPDIKKIQQTALLLPLEEAGKNIKDKEIAEFYRKFLEDAGLTFELSGETE